MTSAYHCGNCPDCDRPTVQQSCKGQFPYCNQGDFSISPIMIDIIGIIGCLSHPSAQAALREEGAKQERERVLKEFEEVIRLHDVDELLYTDLYNEFLKIWKAQSRNLVEAS